MRKYTSSDGTKFDPTKEWYQSIYDIDEVVSLNKEYNKKLSFYPHVVGALDIRNLYVNEVLKKNLEN